MTQSFMRAAYFLKMLQWVDMNINLKTKLIHKDVTEEISWGLYFKVMKITEWKSMFEHQILKVSQSLKDQAENMSSITF